MEVRTLTNTLAVFHANSLVEKLTERLAQVEVNTLGSICSKVEADALVETLSA